MQEDPRLRSTTTDPGSIGC